MSKSRKNNKLSINRERLNKLLTTPFPLLRKEGIKKEVFFNLLIIYEKRNINCRARFPNEPLKKGCLGNSPYIFCSSIAQFNYTKQRKRINCFGVLPKGRPPASPDEKSRGLFTGNPKIKETGGNSNFEKNDSAKPRACVYFRKS